jgi:hypothetical protein
MHGGPTAETTFSTPRAHSQPANPSLKNILRVGLEKPLPIDEWEIERQRRRQRVEREKEKAWTEHGITVRNLLEGRKKPSH